MRRLGALGAVGVSEGEAEGRPDSDMRVAGVTLRVVGNCGGELGEEEEEEG